MQTPNKCPIQSCKGKNDCLQHCPCDCHPQTPDVTKEYLEFCKKENIKTGYNQKLETTIVSDWWLAKLSSSNLALQKDHEILVNTILETKKQEMVALLEKVEGEVIKLAIDPCSDFDEEGQGHNYALLKVKEIIKTLKNN